LVHLYLRIFNLSFEKIKTKKQLAQLPLHSLLKKYVVTMLDLLIHAQTSDIPKVLLRFEASHVLVYINRYIVFYLREIVRKARTCLTINSNKKSLCNA